MQEIMTEQGASKGIAMGKAFLVKAPDLTAEKREITEEQAEREKAAFCGAVEKAREALIDSQRRHRRIMHILIGLLVVLSVFVAAYLIRDIFDGSWGYIHY